MPSIRVFSEKKADVNAVASHLFQALKTHLNLTQLERVRVLNCFDVFDEENALTDKTQQDLIHQVLTDPTVERVFDKAPIDVLVAHSDDHFRLALEYLPGQFDQRADAAEQCARLLAPELASLHITSATCYVFYGTLTNVEQAAITDYLLNPIEMRVKDLEKLALDTYPAPEDVRILDGFNQADDATLTQIADEMRLAMTLADLREIRDYFNAEDRDPTDTEIRVLDTYWSDHCRHTTFLTELEQINIDDEAQKATFAQYLSYREASGISERPITLMDLATINARYLRKQGKHDDVEVSDEVNACSVFIDVETEGRRREPWLLQFKNETHNHPTEIEPFGGASTCLGGAIRDPLSGRAYVYQAARVSGAADPTQAIADTLPNKLSQYRICTEAAKGFASYGNQIGLTTTQVSEVYHAGYLAKRMEVGAVVAAAPAQNVKRLTPAAGDKIILVGGRTGRDGVGGASGSSKSHSEDSLATCGAEVQKGNPPIERAIQRLFRDADVATMIKKCNDFGAGGVCVAVGELADGITVNLDVIPTKYQGLSGTELAISESQERMAVIVDADDVDPFLAKAIAENNEATVIGEVTDKNRFTIMHNGRAIVDLGREFIDSAGAKQSQHEVSLSKTEAKTAPFAQNSDSQTRQEDNAQTVTDTLLTHLNSLSHSSQKGLQDQFDSNVGASTVLLPYGGKTQTSPSEGSVQLLPVRNAKTASSLTWGFDPQLSEWSPYHGGMYAVTHSVCKQIALGADLADVHLSLQEYFQKLKSDAELWGKPFSALLGAFKAQAEFELGAIGGKDSMSGSYSDGEKDIHVPPTLISFAVAHLPAEQVIGATLTKPDEFIYLLKHTITDDLSPNFAQLREHFDFIAEHRNQLSAIITAKQNGYLPELVKAAFGNRIGFSIEDNKVNFTAGYGDFVLVSDTPLQHDSLHLLGKTNASQVVELNGETLAMDAAYHAYINALLPIYPHLHNEVEEQNVPTADTYRFNTRKHSNVMVLKSPLSKKPRVYIPVFPGMNSEYDLDNAFTNAGAKCQQHVFVNLTPELTQQSIDAFAKQLDTSQILAISGGFSLGDEPNGSGKYIAMVLRTPKLQDKLQQFLERDGLIIGICNGFQALVKSGLLPYGEVLPRAASHPTLEENTTGRHIARLAMTRVCQTESPWLNDFALDQVHDVAFSHTEGRFIVDDDTLNTLIDNGQIAFQYCDDSANASMHRTFNPNGSTAAIEGIISPCGKILGKMGHSERATHLTYRNYPNYRRQDLFTSAVNYFK